MASKVHVPVIKYAGGDAYNPIYVDDKTVVRFDTYNYLKDYFEKLAENDWKQLIAIDVTDKYFTNQRKCTFVQLRYIIHLKTSYTKKSIKALAKIIGGDLFKDSKKFIDNIEKCFYIMNTKGIKECNPIWRQFNFKKDDTDNKLKVNETIRTKLDELDTSGMLKLICNFDGDLIKFSPKWCIKFYINKVLYKNEFIAGFQVLGCTFPGMVMNQETANNSVPYCINAIDISEPIVKIAVDNIIAFNTGKVEGKFGDTYMDILDENALKLEEVELAKLKERVALLEASINTRKERMAARKKVRDEKGDKDDDDDEVIVEVEN